MRVEIVDQLPGVRIRHPHAARRARDRSEPLNRIEQLHLARTDDRHDAQLQGKLGLVHHDVLRPPIRGRPVAV